MVNKLYKISENFKEDIFEDNIDTEKEKKFRP